MTQPQAQFAALGLAVLRGGSTVVAPPTGVIMQSVLASFSASMAIGDLDGDGFADLFAGATDKTLPEAHSFGFVLRGAAGGVSSSAMTMLANPASGLDFGTSIAELVSAGSDTALVVTDQNARAAYVFSSALKLLGTLHDGASGNRYGITVGAGDFAGDGYTDLVVGATDQRLPDQSDSAGSAFVYSWTPSALQMTGGTQLGDATSVDATSVDANESFGQAISP